MDHLLNQITHPIICAQCETDLLAGKSDARNLQEMMVLDVGFTEQGLQIWCRRHDINICHIDFAGHQLAADFRCLEKRPKES
ncbi:MAG: hypothetical protein ACON41_05565 [Parvibaculales bacterium]